MGEASVSAAEVGRFNALASRWWDPVGPMRPLHAMNPARVGWIYSQIARRFPACDGLRLLDVGCGAGLAAEALSQHGLDVLGIDAAEDVIEAARKHAGDGGPAYRVALADDLLAEGLRFPVITALEVIEHVPDPAGFVRVLVKLLSQAVCWCFRRSTEPGDRSWSRKWARNISCGCCRSALMTGGHF